MPIRNFKIWALGFFVYIRLFGLIGMKHETKIGIGCVYMSIKMLFHISLAMKTCIHPNAKS